MVLVVFPFLDRAGVKRFNSHKKCQLLFFNLKKYYAFREAESLFLVFFVVDNKSCKKLSAVTVVTPTVIPMLVVEPLLWPSAVYWSAREMLLELW